MVRSVGTVAFALVALGLSRDPGGCGGVGDGDGTVNAPCTRDKDCRQGLSCVEGVCTSPDSGTEPPKDAATGDGG